MNVLHTKNSSRHVVGLLALVAMACSLRSLDDLQQGGPAKATGAGGATLDAGGASSAGGTHAAVGSSSQAGGTTAVSTTNVTPSGGTTVSLGGTNHGGESAVGGVTWASGGTNLAGGATSQTNSGGGLQIGGTANAGGVTTTGGSSNSGAMPSTGGKSNIGGTTNTNLATGGSLSAGGTPTTGGSSSLGGTTGGNASTGGAPTTGGTRTAVTAATGGSGTGGAAAMTYNVPGQSCGAGLNCLTGGSSGVSCCAQIEVPSGTFQMGTNSDPSRYTDEQPPHTANVDAFLMDEFEVTVGRFRRFYQAYDGTLPATGAGALPSRSDTGWQVDYNANMPASQGALDTAINCDVGQYQTWTEVAGVYEKMPMNCVTWYIAFAFCIWDGGRLPSEAEWEDAASSGAKEWRFPWGSTDPDPATDAVMNCLGDGTSGCSPTDILPVGSRPAGANTWGHLDLAGSMWEWTLDYYDATYYQSIGTCNNCVNTAKTTPRVIRGGDFTSTETLLRATDRASKPPVNFDPYVGFRCVRTP